MTFFVHARKRAKRRLGSCRPCALLLVTLVAVPALAAERVELRIAGQRLTVEVAATPAQRAQGLMGRPPRDTPSALAAAFIDASGRILNTVEMQPQTDTRHCSRAPARYALEAQAGWFAARGIKPGESVRGLEGVAPASR